MFVCVSALPPLLLRDPTYKMFKEVLLMARIVFRALAGVGTLAINYSKFEIDYL